MEAFRRTVRLVRLNWKTLVLFELFYKAMVAAGFTLLVSCVFRLLMSAMGITYLTRESLGAFLLHPLTLVSILLVTLLAVTCTVTDLCAVVYILDCSAQGFRCRMRQVLRFTLRNVPRVWKPGNLPLAAIVLLLTPFMSLSLIFGLLSTVSLPEFIQESIRQNPHI